MKVPSISLRSEIIPYFLAHHFREDAAEAPDVDGGGVGLGAEEDLWCAVPERDDLVGVGADGEGEGAGEAEVGELDGAAVVDEQVLRLEVAVEDAVRVAVRDARQQLLHVALKSKGDQIMGEARRQLIT